jgi:hypothetical protein
MLRYGTFTATKLALVTEREKGVIGCRIECLTADIQAASRRKAGTWSRKDTVMGHASERARGASAIFAPNDSRAR